MAVFMNYEEKKKGGGGGGGVISWLYCRHTDFFVLNLKICFFSFFSLNLKKSKWFVAGCVFSVSHVCGVLQLLIQLLYSDNNSSK